MTWARLVKLVAKAGIAAVALGALAISGNAQTVYQGKFTLAVETRWGSSTLPAGDYTFTLTSSSAPYRLYIHGQHADAIIQAVTAEDVTSHQAQLNLVDIADVHAVQTFDAPELGVSFTYWIPKQRRVLSKEARQKAVPQAAPTSQATENRTSIKVYTAGR